MQKQTTMTFKEYGELKLREETNQLELSDLIEPGKETSSTLCFMLALGYLVLGGAVVSTMLFGNIIASIFIIL